MPADKREKNPIQQQFSDDDILLTSSSLFPSQQIPIENLNEPGT
jgi:hypothetical protein